MATAYEFVAVADEGLMLRCPDCGATFVQNLNDPAAPLGCPDCDGEGEDYEDNDPAEIAAGEDDGIEDDIDGAFDYGEESDPCDPYDMAYADSEVEQGRFDDDPNPYSGE
jgi:hypothetical protein